MSFSLQGGRSRSSSSSQGRSFVDPSQKQYFDDIFSRAQDFSNNSTFTGLDPLQEQAQQMALDQSGNIANDIGAASGANNFLLNNIMDVNSNPYLKGYANAAINPLKESLMKDVLPTINKDALGGNAFSSSRKDLAQNRALENFTRQAGDITSKIYGDAYNTNLGAYQNAIDRTPTLANASLMPSQVVGDIGAQNRDVAQQQILDPYLQLQRYRDILGPANILNEQNSRGRSSSWNAGGEFDF